MGAAISTEEQRVFPETRSGVLSVEPRHLKNTKVFWWASDRHALLRRFQRRCVWTGLAVPVEGAEQGAEPAMKAKYRFHDLRNTFGSYAAMSSVSLEVIAEAMGHTSTTVTKLYAHLHPEYKRKELAKMEGFGTRKGQERGKRAKLQGGSHS
jgi:integrase